MTTTVPSSLPSRQADSTADSSAVTSPEITGVAFRIAVQGKGGSAVANPPEGTWFEGESDDSSLRVANNEVESRISSPESR